MGDAHGLKEQGLPVLVPDISVLAPVGIGGYALAAEGIDESSCRKVNRPAREEKIPLPGFVLRKGRFYAQGKDLRAVAKLFADGNPKWGLINGGNFYIFSNSFRRDCRQQNLTPISEYEDSRQVCLILILSNLDAFVKSPNRNSAT